MKLVDQLPHKTPAQHMQFEVADNHLLDFSIMRTSKGLTRELAIYRRSRQGGLLHHVGGDYSSTRLVAGNRLTKKAIEREVAEMYDNWADIKATIEAYYASR